MGTIGLLLSGHALDSCYPHSRDRDRSEGDRLAMLAHIHEGMQTALDHPAEPLTLPPDCHWTKVRFGANTVVGDESFTLFRTYRIKDPAVLSTKILGGASTVSPPRSSTTTLPPSARGHEVRKKYKGISQQEAERREKEEHASYRAGRAAGRIVGKLKKIFGGD